MSDASSSFQSAEAAAVFRAGDAQRAGYLGPATERMFALAQIRPGIQVLDVGAGTGEQTLRLADRLAGQGNILAVDVSERMLAAARETVASRGISNVEFAIMDATHLQLESDRFDAAISRNVLQFIADPASAVAEICRVIKPGARFAASVWSGPDRHLWFSVPLEIVRQRCAVPAPELGRPGALALGDLTAFEGVLRRGGLRDVTVERVPANRVAGSALELVGQYRTGNAAIIELIGQLPESEREAAWQAVADELRRFEGPDGCVVPGEALVGVGSK